MRDLGYIQFDAGSMSSGGTANRGGSFSIPEFGDFLDVISDGGAPFRVVVQGAVDRLVRTGDRVPVVPGAMLKITRESELEASLPADTTGRTWPRCAFLSSEAALRIPPPSTTATEIDGQTEQVVNAAAARAVGLPIGFLRASLLNNGIGTVFVGKTAALATAHVTSLLAGSVMDWPGGPLFVHNNSGADVTIEVASEVKRR